MCFSIASFIWLILFRLASSFSALPSPSLFNDSSNALKIRCFRGEAWTKPHWPATVYMNYHSILRHLLVSYAQPNQDQAFEFLPVDAPQTSLVSPAVRTPFKFVRGMWSTFQHKSTTLLPPDPTPNTQSLKGGKEKYQAKQPAFRQQSSS